jgi:hypothetical protein
MPPETNSSPLDADARRLTLEAIATLVNIKRIAADQLLRPAGVPQPLIQHFVKGRDPSTGDPLTKRQGGAHILEELSKTGADREFVRKVVDLTANWNSFHLASNEYDARGVVQKARELAGTMAEADAREKQQQEAAAKERSERVERERQATVRQGSKLLLAQFDAAMAGEERQERGYFLEDLMNRAFDLHGLPATRPFRRNEGGEQIDGAFELDGWHYIVECRWREALSNIQQLDALSGKVNRSGKQTMGLFLSVNGWSEHVVPLVKQNRDKSIILMEGFDLRTVLDRPFDLRQLLRSKARALNLEAEPYFPISRLIA